jgi:HNH endonuclease
VSWQTTPGRAKWAERPQRESLSKRLGKTAFAIRERDNHKCIWCGQKADEKSPLHLDHLIPHSRGGSDDPTNLVSACRWCNDTRHDMKVGEWIKYQQAHGYKMPSAAEVYGQARRKLPEIARGSTQKSAGGVYAARQRGAEQVGKRGGRYVQTATGSRYYLGRRG